MITLVLGEVIDNTLEKSPTILGRSHGKYLREFLENTWEESWRILVGGVLDTHHSGKSWYNQGLDVALSLG